MKAEFAEDTVLETDDPLLSNEMFYLTSSKNGLQYDEVPSESEYTRAPHQCNVCNKIFVSYKGLQQHAVIHTDMKPFQCEVCSKEFRFKSNLFEHRSIHTGYQVYQCSFCGKSCRLKGNLKKHMRTHVSTNEELEEAWKPFSSNRRPAMRLPENPVILQSSSFETGFGSLQLRPRVPKRQSFNLDPSYWVNRVLSGDICPTAPLEDKIEQIQKEMERCSTIDEILAQTVPFETVGCSLCNSSYLSRSNVRDHELIEHALATKSHNFCNICHRLFNDETSMTQHTSYHKRVQQLLQFVNDDYTIYELSGFGGSHSGE
ncbi:unnamed protein product [Caenorhabditis auriculariae]|uniref:C2H2-type domain-containing protein n=1 Tax=Caenorhabditis auriculariae TaxID=2777116 RepID=A0A8S1GTU7_9PELO|nr:unnamed protein product [Caenorhabditis auriculariae]